ncbi:MAG: right-handed parallel beta-helix repeat-containing protein, partial [Candidatus Heimdallarchaeota archaeon]|nr:right-handed parallel beta-helix repeat-containing protein [Candidatus Heimdallarchaeota archaeon]
MKKKALLFLLILTLSIYASNINVQITAKDNNYQPTSLELIPHDSISITSDSELEVFPGIGTVEDPYLIDGYNITTTNDCGIRISGTTKYFIVRNCYIEDIWYGIVIFNVADGTATVINNTCENNSYGIILEYSGSSTVANNTCNNNYIGIWFRDSVSSTVVNNTCNNNGRGISLVSSGDSTVTNNAFTNCGLSIGESTVYAYLSYTLENNCVNGKKLGFYTNLDSTTIAEPVYGQLILVNCTNVTVRDQILNSSTTGLILYFCKYLVITNNTCSNNNNYGIKLWFSSGSTLTNNTSNNNGYRGIYLFHSGSCTFTYNLLQE